MLRGIKTNHSFLKLEFPPTKDMLPQRFDRMEMLTPLRRRSGELIVNVLSTI